MKEVRKMKSEKTRLKVRVSKKGESAESAESAIEVGKVEKLK